MTSYFSGAVDIGGRSLYATVRGDGPVVVLNSGGGRESIGTWCPIEPELASFATVVVYDRAGLGRSDAAPAPPTAADMVSDLRALLGKLGLDTPALLVGASLSALMAQLYACMYPTAVSALLLLDPTPEAPLAGFASHPPAVQHAIRQAMLKNAAELGMDEQGLSEVQHLPESCSQFAAALTAAAGAPDVPVVVVTAMKSPEISNQKGKGGLKVSLSQAHKSIVARYPRGRQLFAEKSSHQTIVTNEPQLVLSAIRTLLDLAAW